MITYCVDVLPDRNTRVCSGIRLVRHVDKHKDIEPSNSCIVEEKIRYLKERRYWIYRILDNNMSIILIRGGVEKVKYISIYMGVYLSGYIFIYLLSIIITEVFK